MKLTAIFTLMLSAATLTATAADVVTGEGYTYLAIELINGTSQTLTADGLKLSYNNGVMTAENGNEKVSVSLAALSRMYFTNTITDDDISTTTGISDASRQNGETINDKTGEVFDMQGRRVNGQWSMVNGQWSEVNGQLKKGVYIVRENGKAKTIQIK